MIFIKFYMFHLSMNWMINSFFIIMRETCVVENLFRKQPFLKNIFFFNFRTKRRRYTAEIDHRLSKRHHGAHETDEVRTFLSPTKTELERSTFSRSKWKNKIHDSPAVGKNKSSTQWWIIKRRKNRAVKRSKFSLFTNDWRFFARAKAEVFTAVGSHGNGELFLPCFSNSFLFRFRFFPPPWQLSRYYVTGSFSLNFSEQFFFLQT